MGFDIVAVSGYSGGRSGPADLYNRLTIMSSEGACRFFAIDTVAEDMEENVERVVQAVKQRGLDPSKTYLMGYSMGGAVVAEASERLAGQGFQVGGLILLSTQTDGLYPLFERKLPSLFFHGTRDDIFRPSEIEYIASRCLAQKKIVWLKGLNHDWKLDGQVYRSTVYSDELARAILAEINAFISSIASDEPSQSSITMEIGMTPVDRAINGFAQFFKRFYVAIAMFLLGPLVHRKTVCIMQFLQDLCLG